MTFRVGARTDVGRVREGNEDAYMAEDPLFAVADGMGGHQGGEVASHVALKTLGRISGQPAPDGDVAPALADTIREANRAVLEKARADPGLQGMGTTLTALLAGDGKVFLAHVGDSRAYLLRSGELRRLTRDHTMVERLVEQGRLSPQEAEMHPQRSILTNALGVDREIQVDEATHEIEPGDRLLLCSDGLTGMVPEEEITRMLTDIADPQEAADALVEAANQAGGQDNITVVVLDSFDEDAETAATPEAATRRWESIPARTLPGAGEGGRRWLRVVVWSAVALIVVVAALFAVKGLFIDQQWFVGEHQGRVALFRGIPARPLGISLSNLEQETDVPAERIEEFPDWRNLDEGITAESREEAEALIEQMRRDLAAAEREARRSERS